LFGEKNKFMNDKILISNWKILLACFMSGVLTVVGIVELIATHYFLGIWCLLWGIIGAWAFLINKTPNNNKDDCK